MRTVYADNAASTPIRHEALGAMQESYEHYGNPSCANAMGKKSRELVEAARNQIAQSIGAKPNEIIFTSGGTESNNLAIHGFVDANRGDHIITTRIEHASVLNPIRYLQDCGYDVTYLPVDNEGMINLQQLQRAIRRDTMLISIMFANNEIGTIQPIKEIGAISKRYKIPFHTDAVQAFGHCDIDVKELNIDMMSLSGHKIYAPKGIGVLYARNDIDLIPLLHGGGQEYALRSGTENVIGIVGMGKAVELLNPLIINWSVYSSLKDKLINGITSKIPDVKLNGSKENSLPGVANISFKDVDGKELIAELSDSGIYTSNSEVCGYGNPSHVLTEIGLTNDYIYGAVRFSFGMYNTSEDIDYILEFLPGLVEKLRSKR